MSQMDFKALAGHILNPSRPRLAEARAVVEGCDDPSAAWERLVREGLVPAEWREDPRRTFMSLCEACGGMSVIIEAPSARNDAELCPRCKGMATLKGSHPPTARGCVAIASAVEGLAEAEALAHRIAAAFEQRREQVVWHLSARPESLHGTGWTRDVREALASRYARARKKTWRVLHSRLFHELQPTFGPMTDYVAELEGLRRLWGEQQPNPFDTVLEMLATGYVFLALDEDALHLIAPLAGE